MSELKAFAMIMSSEEFYLKSEADKVIAEKDKELRHHKYKRCLLMAKVCERLSWEFKDLFYGTDCESLQSAYNHKIEHYRKWQIKWMELADKFKDAK